MPNDAGSEPFWTRHSKPEGSELRRLRDRAHLAADRLHSRYGSPRHGNKDDPLDEVVFILLSQMTTHHSFGRVFDRLKTAVSDWELLLDMPLTHLQILIADAGLSGQKAPRIKEIARRLRADFGAVSLAPLRSMDDSEAERYLTALPGIGIKSARCVLMYALGREVLPVDTHVWRISRRIGLVPELIPYTRVHNALHHVVRRSDRYRFHVNALPLGRRVCIAKTPRCDICPIIELCPTGKSRVV